MGIYKDILNKGIINFTDDSVHWIRYIVKDFAGNTTELMLKVKSRSTPVVCKTIGLGPPLFDCAMENQFNTEDIKVAIPANAMYDDIVFKYSKPASVKGTYSPLHQIMTDETALQKSMSLSIKPVRLPDSLQTKACIVSVNKKGKKSYEGGSYKDGWVSTLTKEFGNYAVTVDTIAPKLKPAFKYNPTITTDLSKAKRIGITAIDDLSGIRKYRMIIDGKWVLCEYEFKQNLLFYTFDDAITKENHTFTIEVTDDKENKSTFTFIFSR